MSWSDLFAALALCCILEGLLPFASPRKAKRNFLLMSTLPTNALRTMGGAAIIVGLIILSLARS